MLQTQVLYIKIIITYSNFQKYDSKIAGMDIHITFIYHLIKWNLLK